MDFSMVELLGYAASIMVAISLTMKDIVKLRVLNFVAVPYLLHTAWQLILCLWLLLTVSLHA